MFAVAVTLHLHPGTQTEFLKLAYQNAAASLRSEPGCHQFDVAADPDLPEEVFLYELYSDADAFQAHLKTEHFANFDAAVSEMVITKEIKTYRQVTQ